MDGFATFRKAFCSARHAPTSRLVHRAGRWQGCLRRWEFAAKAEDDALFAKDTLLDLSHQLKCQEMNMLLPLKSIGEPRMSGSWAELGGSKAANKYFKKTDEKVQELKKKRKHRQKMLKKKAKKLQKEAREMEKEDLAEEKKKKKRKHNKHAKKHKTQAVEDDESSDKQGKQHEKAAEDSETNSESPHMQGKKHMVHSEEQSENMPEAADGQSNPNETPPEKLMPRVKGEEVPTGKHTVVVGDERTAQRDEVSNLEHQGVLQKIRQQLDGQTKGQQEDQQSEAPESALKPDEIVKPELDARKAKVVYETLAPMQVFKDQQDALKDSASLSQKEPRQEQKKLGGNQFGLLLGTD